MAQASLSSSDKDSIISELCAESKVKLTPSKKPVKPKMAKTKKDEVGSLRGEMESKFREYDKSMDNKMDSLKSDIFSFFREELNRGTKRTSVSSEESSVRKQQTADSGPSGAGVLQTNDSQCRSKGQYRLERDMDGSSSVAATSFPINNSLNRDYGVSDPAGENSSTMDSISLAPGQQEIGDMCLSDEEVGSSVSHEGGNVNARFTRLVETPSETELNILSNIFGKDAKMTEKDAKMGLSLDQSQKDVLDTTLHCQRPDKLTSFKEEYRQNFPVQEKSVKFLALPSLDETIEAMLGKRFGVKAKGQSLITQPLKTMEKLAYQGQSAARMNIIINCYIQQALANLKSQLQKPTPNLDGTTQLVQDIFAMTTAALDQSGRVSALFHMIRRKASMYETGLTEVKDTILKDRLVQLPLSQDGVFGSALDSLLKDRKEKSQQLSELLPEMNSKTNNYPKRKSEGNTFNQSSSSYGSAYKRQKTSEGNKPQYSQQNRPQFNNYKAGKDGGNFKKPYNANFNRNSFRGKRR